MSFDFFQKHENFFHKYVNFRSDFSEKSYFSNKTQYFNSYYPMFTINR